MLRHATEKIASQTKEEQSFCCARIEIGEADERSDTSLQMLSLTGMPPPRNNWITGAVLCASRKCRGHPICQPFSRDAAIATD